jgi:transposase
MQITLHHPEDLELLRQYSRQQLNAKRSRGFVQRWVYHYRDHGLETLGPQRQSGRPSKLPVSQCQAFKTRFLADPTSTDGVCTLRAKEARQVLAQEFGVEYTLGGIYDLLHRLDLSDRQRLGPQITD